MPYDERLASRVRKVFGTRADVTERRMFGGLAFLCKGRMCCGIVGSDLMVRIPGDEFEAVMRGRHVRPMDFTGGAAICTICIVALYHLFDIHFDTCVRGRSRER